MIESQRWYYAEREQTLGPISAEQIEALIQDGIISGSTYLVVEGTETWLQASDSVFAGHFSVHNSDQTGMVGTLDSDAVRSVDEKCETPVKTEMPNQGGQKLANFFGGRFAHFPRCWIVLVTGILAVGSTIFLLHHYRHWRSSRDAGGDAKANTLEVTPHTAYPSLTKQDRNETTFDSMLSAFLSANRRVLSDDVQEFRFGSTVDDVCANYLKQYGQRIDPVLPTSTDFAILKTQFEGPRTISSNRIQQDFWIMAFGFYRSRLVSISKTYRNSVDPKKTADFIRHYFEVDGSNDDDLFGQPGFFQSDHYVGFLDWKSGSSDINAFRLFQVQFLRDVLDSHFRTPVRDFVDSIQKTDFDGRPKFGGNVYISFKGFPSAYGPVPEFKLSSEQASANQFTEGAPINAYRYLSADFTMFIVQTLFPPKSGSIEKTDTNQSRYMKDTRYRWEGKDRYFVMMHEGTIEIGRKPDTPDPDKL